MERYYLFEHVHMETVSQKSQGKATGKNEKGPWMSSTPHPKDFINTFYYIVHTNVQIQKFYNVWADTRTSVDHIKKLAVGGNILLWKKQ